MKTRMLFHTPDNGLPSGFAKAAFAAMVAAGTPAPEETPKPSVEGTPPSKKEEPPAANDDDPPENLPNEGRSDVWKNFRKQYNETRARAKASEGELETLKTQLADFEGTKKERDALKAQISDVEKERAKWKEYQTTADFDTRPDVQAQYVTPRNEALAQLKELSGYADVSADAITGAMAKTGKARFEALEDILTAVPTVLRGKIERVIDQIDGFDSGLAKERGNAAESIRQRDARLAQERTQRQEQAKQQALAVFDETAAEMKDLGLPPEEIAKARKFFIENGDLKEAARVLMRGHAQDLTVKQQAAIKKELDDTKAELARLKKATPSVEGNRSQQTSQPEKGANFVDGAKAVFRESRAA